MLLKISAGSRNSRAAGRPEGGAEDQREGRDRMVGWDLTQGVEKMS